MSLNEQLEELKQKLEFLQGQLASLTLDQVKDTADRYAFSVNWIDALLAEVPLDCLKNERASSTNNYATLADVTERQPAGDYLEHKDNVVWVKEDFLPAGDINIGNQENPFRELFVSKLLHMAKATLRFDKDDIYINGEPYKSRIQHLATRGPQFLKMEEHVRENHGWAQIVKNTKDLEGISAFKLRRAVVEHPASSDHDERYVTKTQLAEAAAAADGPFRKYMQRADLDLDSSGSIGWDKIHSVPEWIANELPFLQYKGVVGDPKQLPVSGIERMDFFITLMDPLEKNKLNPNMYICVDENGKSTESVYTTLLDTKRLNHKDLIGITDDDAHPQYVCGSSFVVLLKTQLDMIAEELGVDTGRMLTPRDEQILSAVKDHCKASGNPHSITPATIKAIPDEPKAVKVKHIDTTGLTTSMIEDSADRLFMNHFQEVQITASSSHMNDSSIHITEKEKNNLFSGKDSAMHYHAADRDLENATGELSINRVSDLRNTLAALASEIQLVEKAAHSEHHDLVSHSDVSITGDQLNKLHMIHDKVGDLHNACFVSKSKETGSSPQAARADHVHDELYLNKNKILNLSKPGAELKVHAGNIIGLEAIIKNLISTEPMNVTQSTLPK